jgi:hypothetical protein
LWESETKKIVFVDRGVVMEFPACSLYYFLLFLDVIGLTGPVTKDLIRRGAGATSIANEAALLQKAVDGGGVRFRDHS